MNEKFWQAVRARGFMRWAYLAVIGASLGTLIAAVTDVLRRH